jgi:hypothetical protein
MRNASVAVLAVLLATMVSAATVAVDISKNLARGHTAKPANTVNVDGATVKLTLDGIGGVYKGILGSDGHSIDGAWTWLDVTRPLTLRPSHKRAPCRWIQPGQGPLRHAG